MLELLKISKHIKESELAMLDMLTKMVNLCIYRHVYSFERYEWLHVQIKAIKSEKSSLKS